MHTSQNYLNFLTFTNVFNANKRLQGAKSYELEGTNNNAVYTAYSEPNERAYSSDNTPGSGCVQAIVELPSADTTKIAYSLTMRLRGSGSIGVTPVGHRNEIKISVRENIPVQRHVSAQYA